MAYIKVNHKKMAGVADKVDEYVSSISKNMNAIDFVVFHLGAEWRGEDYIQFKKEWNEINSGGSTTDKMKTSLKSYSDSVRESAQLYKDAQSRAVNRAKNLCK